MILSGGLWDHNIQIMSLIREDCFTLSLPFHIKSYIMLLVSLITSLSKLIKPAQYIIIGITKVLTIRILPITVWFLHLHNLSFSLIECMISLKFSFCLRATSYVKCTPRIFTALLTLAFFISMSLFTYFGRWFPRKNISVLS